MSNEKVKISLCMIVKNEQDQLPRCLGSVADIVDEIVIVDTGSTDNTRQSVEEYGIKWIDFAWCDDFSAARNRSIEAAQGEWILVLDADEYIDPENCGKLTKLVAADEGKAYFLNFINKLPDSAVGNEMVHSHARLFKSGHGITFRGRIHEQITSSVNESGLKVENSNIYVEHYGYSSEMMESRDKTRRNIEILLKMQEDEPRNGMTCFYLGESYSLAGDFAKAVEQYQRAAGDASMPEMNLALVYQNLGTAYYNLNEFEKALEAEEIAIEKGPGRVTPRVVMAEAASRLGKFDRAIWNWRKVIDNEKADVSERFEKLAEHIPDHAHSRKRLVESYFLSGDMVSAREQVQTALKIDPNSIELLILSAKIEGNLGEFERAKEYCDQVLSIEPGNKDAGAMLNELKKPAEVISRKTDRISPDSLAPVERKQEIETLLKTGNKEQAEIEIEKTLQTYPEDPDILFFAAYRADMNQEYEKVIELSLKSHNYNQKNVRPLILLSSAQIRLSRHKDAEITYRKLIRIDPQMVDAWNGLGAACVKLENYSGAKDAFEQAFKLEPDNIQIKKNLAVVCSKLGLQSEAEKYFLMTKM